MAIRIIFAIFLFLSVLFMPFWLSALLALFGMIYFSKFYEGLVMLALSDLLYGVREEKFLSVVFISLVLGSICLVLIEQMKKKLKFYQVIK